MAAEPALPPATTRSRVPPPTRPSLAPDSAAILRPEVSGGGRVGLTLGRTSWQSPLDGSRRYALCGDHFYKIERHDLAKDAPLRRQDLAGERRILERCRGIPGVPAVVDWLETPGMRVLVTGRVDGVPLSRLEPGWPRLLGVWLRLLVLVVRLAWRGVSHDDLRPENVLIDRRGAVWLIDFDQASTGSVVACLLRSCFAISLGGIPVSNAIVAPLRERLQARLPPSAIRFLKGRRNRRQRDRDLALPPLPEDAGPRLWALHEAWRRAADSSASSPGRAIAYYELEVDGLRLPGERDWAARWRSLAHVTDYRGRRVLELGCNMALLSIFLLKDAGAAATLAVDCDPTILEAAALAAAAFGVEPRFARIDLDRDPDWETTLEAFRPDLVFALSVLNWVADKERLLAFLGRFDEVIFEGHDSTSTERRRLRAAGFEAIELVATSERGRPILHCRKRDAA